MCVLGGILRRLCPWLILNVLKMPSRFTMILTGLKHLLKMIEWMNDPLSPTRSPENSCLMLSDCLWISLSALGLNLSEVHIWTRSESWQARKDDRTPFTSPGSTQMTGERMTQSEYWEFSNVPKTGLSSCYIFLCSYNESLEVMLNLISQQPDRYKIIVATHNEESVRKAVTWYDMIYGC